MRHGTVCFLRKDDEVLLALIEYPDGSHKWNGIGGMVEDGEELEEATAREIDEETFIEVEPEDLVVVGSQVIGELELHVLVGRKWSGELKVKEPSLKELRWFPVENLPWDQMWEGNREWLSGMLDKA